METLFEFNNCYDCVWPQEKTFQSLRRAKHVMLFDDVTKTFFLLKKNKNPYIAQLRGQSFEQGHFDISERGIDEHGT